MHMGMDRARQNLRFDIAPQGYVILWRLGMRDAHDVLFDDRAFVQIARHIMRGRPDQLHPAFIGLFVGVRPLEGWQKGMVDIDDPPIHLAAQIVGQDLHVAGQCDHFGPSIIHQLQKLRFGGGFGLGRDLDVVKRNVVVHHQFLIIQMVGHDRDNIQRQRPDAPAIQQVVQAMAEARHHDDGAALDLFIEEFRLHPEARGHRAKAHAQIVQPSPAFGPEADAHEETVGFQIVELGGIGDVAIGCRKEIRNRGHDAARRSALHAKGIGRHGRACWFVRPLHRRQGRQRKAPAVMPGRKGNPVGLENGTRIRAP